MPEGLNPTRRYKWFRPRQMMRGLFSLLAPTHTADILLYNNSLGTHVLVVRQIQGAFGASFGMFVNEIVGTVGTHTGHEKPVVSDGAQLPGQIFTLDDAAPLTSGDYFLPVNAQANQTYFTYRDLPISVLNPNKSLLLTADQTGGSFIGGFIWEAITIDELDFAYEL